MTGFIGLFDAASDYTLEFTITHTQSSVQSRLHYLLLGGGFQCWTFPSVWVPELSPASATVF
jgi:hypothetical protein